ncbi:MAG: MBL fold metallo-hydrolase [Nocardioidaceae bacterium]
MLIAAFPAGPWGTNCYVVATAAGADCVVVDPGLGATEGVAEVIREHRLRPVSLLLTHGHVDHVFSVVPIAGAHECPAYLHPGDRHLLADPAAGISPESAGLLLGSGYSYAEPDDLRELADVTTVTLAGVDFRVDHAPGHTAGSVTFRSPYDGREEVPEVMFSGDLLFAGSIGRTDMPGGDHQTMLHSLTDKVLPLDDGVVVLPGHGPQTTIGQERVSNPYLADLVRSPAERPPESP